jgi:nucleoside-diphosphate-sugar epimerase
MRVLIVGCGYVGLALGARLVQQGHAVWGLRRDTEHAGELGSAGIKPVRADITHLGSLPELGHGFDWVVNCVSASGGGAQESERIYLQGTKNLVAWLSKAPPATFLYTSSTSIYGQVDGSRVDEYAPTEPESATARILVKTERLLLDASAKTGFPSVVLRVAGIYGPRRAYWLDQVRSGQARIEGAGERWINMIHRDDVAGAILTGLAQGQPGRVYNAVDDEPVAQAALLQWLSTRLGCPLPAVAGTGELRAVKNRGLTNKRVSNERLKTELGYRFEFPTFRQGYESLLTG